MGEKNSQRKAFTLVELLIVIIIIGILSGMMLLAVGGATDKAEATKIISALRNYKSATMMYYMDNSAWPTTGTGWDKSLDQYVDRSLDTAVFQTVEVVESAVGSRMLIGLVGAPSSPLTQVQGVQKKIESSARAAAVYKRDGTLYTAGANEVFTNMR